LHILTSSLLLTSALLWVTFGSNLLSSNYGIEREKSIHLPLTTTDHNLLLGKVTYLAFGFSHCVDRCPTTLNNMQLLANLLPKDAQFIFVSVDSHRDSQPHLTHFLTNIHPRIIGLHMNKNVLLQFENQFDLRSYHKTTGSFSHDSAIHVIDEHSHWVRTYPYSQLNINAVLNDYNRLVQTF
ncbi:MAG TPA: hypothetical protein DCS49_02620, partial [Gammaproteobacteria bacterium]|nr:hypothetical protein [Gammaproteobacteria bacterium]